MSEPEKPTFDRVHGFFQQAYSENADEMFLQSAVIEQVRRGALSHGKAAELLGISRWSFVLMKSRHSFRERWSIWRHQRTVRAGQRKFMKSQAPPSLPQRTKQRMHSWRQKKRAFSEHRSLQDDSPSRLTAAKRKFKIWRRIQQQQRQNEEFLRQQVAPPSRLQKVRQRLSISRQLRREQQQIWQLANPAKHRLRQRVQTVIVFAFVLAIAGAYAYIVHRESRRRPDPEDLYKIAVTINGKPVTDDLLMDTLRKTYGSTVLQKLTEQEVVRQEAARLKITLSAAEIQRLSQSVKGDPLSDVHLGELETALLLRKIVLRGIEAERKRDVFRSFRKDVVLYTIGGFRFPNREVANKFVAGLAAGLSIETAAQKFATDGLIPLKLGTYTIPMLEAQLGRAAAEAIGGERPGSNTRPLATAAGFVIYRVLGVADTFEQVEPAIDDIIAEADANRVLYELLAEAKIESPHLDKLVATPTPAASRTPGSLLE